MSSYLGQNFLKDTKYIFFIIQKIEEYCHQYGIETIIEIGPGKGALTKKLLELGKPLILFERDPQMITYLQENIIPQTQGVNISIIQGDVLEQNPVELLAAHRKTPKKTLVAGNLPYYITSPILTQFFGGDVPKFDVGIFMVQKEVADKIKHDAEKKSFLWRLLNYHFDVIYLKTVPAKAFSPKPKVQSSIISLRRKKDTPGCHYGQMKVLLERISMYKRKTLGKSRKMASRSQYHDCCAIGIGDKGISILTLGNYTYHLSEELTGKRIEELSRDDMDSICSEKEG